MMVALRAAWLRLTAAGLLAALVGCGGGGGGGEVSTPPATPASGTVTTFSIDSHQTGISYPISVYVPADAASGAPTPIIYALDAETRFENLMGVLRDTNTRATLVGIANTGADRRQVDFLMPGANAYYRFVTEELVPVVEARYRVDSSRRVLSGHSSSGLFAGYALFKTSPADRRFAAFIVADASFWQQPAEVSTAEVAMHAANAGQSLALTVLMGGDVQGNLAFVDPIYQVLVSRNYAGLLLIERMYNVGHVQMDAPFFRDALAVIFPTGR